MQISLNVIFETKQKLLESSHAILSVQCLIHCMSDGFQIVVDTHFEKVFFYHDDIIDIHTLV